MYTMEQNLQVGHLQTKQNKKILIPGKQTEFFNKEDSKTNSIYIVPVMVYYYG